MNKLTEIFQEIGLVNEKFFSKQIDEKDYKQELKPIYNKLKQAISECKKSQISQ